MKKQYTQIQSVLSTARQVVVISHYNPDGDAIGSSLGLAHYLRHKGYKVTVIMPNDFPDFLKWMPGAQDIIIYENQQTIADEYLQKAQMIFCLDFNATSRVNDLEPALVNAQAIKVIMDHHLAPTDFAPFFYWNSNASSTAEMVYDFIEEANDVELIDAQIASCLYAGLLTDTGMFQFSATTARVHEIVAVLISAGVEVNYVFEKIYNSFSEDRLRFFGFVTTKRLKIYPDLHTAVLHVSLKDQRQFNVGKGDTEGLVNVPLQIKGVDVSVFVKDTGDKRKLSFRSKGDLDVELLARQHFNGGGHKNAAGGISSTTLTETIEKLESVLPKWWDHQNK